MAEFSNLFGGHSECHCTWYERRRPIRGNSISPAHSAVRQPGVMTNKNRPLVDQHAPKDGVGWLIHAQQGKVCRFANDMPTAHAQWVQVETRPLKGGGQPVIRRLLRHNAISAWETMQKSGGWKRCPPKW
jgi:hypothetical protein